MPPRFITYADTVARLAWPDAVAALQRGHTLPRAQVADMFLGPADGILLSRGAHIEGLGYGVKSVTVFGGNPQVGLPSVQGAMLVFEPEHGRLEAIIESRLVTEYKTAADSVLGATLLARPDSRSLLIVGAGTVARSLVHAYSAAMPGIERIGIWSRRPEQARALAGEFAMDGANDGANDGVEVFAAPDLAAAAGEVDIVSTATMARAPILKGEWIGPGTHVDLIGAFTADMREADDTLIATGSLFVDSRETTIHHIGELMIPIANGVIAETAVRGDFYDLVGDPGSGRTSDTEITVFKNGGGAHLDLMMAAYIAGPADAVVAGR